MSDVIPWGLSPRQLQATRLLLKHGIAHKRIAREMQITVKCVEDHLSIARKKAKAADSLLLAVAFDRIVRQAAARSAR